MASARAPRSAWVEEGLRALAEGGADAVRIQPIARRLGVTKGSFYWNFNGGRRALLEAILDRWEEVSVDNVVERIEGVGGEGPVKLRHLFALAASAKDVLGLDPVAMDLAVRDWARREEAVAKRLRRVDNKRMEYMRPLFGEFVADKDEIEARCLLGLSLFVGSQLIAADHSGHSRGEVVELAAGLLLDGT